jgi:hypothetical protein
MGRKRDVIDEQPETVRALCDATAPEVDGVSVRAKDLGYAAVAAIADSTAAAERGLRYAGALAGAAGIPLEVVLPGVDPAIPTGALPVIGTDAEELDRELRLSSSAERLLARGGGVLLVGPGVDDDAVGRWVVAGIHDPEQSGALLLAVRDLAYVFRLSVRLVVMDGAGDAEVDGLLERVAAPGGGIIAVDVAGADGRHFGGARTARSLLRRGGCPVYVQGSVAPPGDGDRYGIAKLEH